MSDAPKSTTAPLIVLWKPNTPENIGSALRSCACYGARLVVVDPRCKMAKAKTRRKIQQLATFAKNRVFFTIAETELDDWLDGLYVLPIEKDERSVDLAAAVHHPGDAYIFGPEEGSVPRHILDKYGPPAQILTENCLDLAAAVATVLYDRAAKASGHE